MEFEEGGARKTILEFVVRAICEIYTLARPGGINRTTMLNNKLNASMSLIEGSINYCH